MQATEPQTLYPPWGVASLPRQPSGQQHVNSGNPVRNLAHQSSKDRAPEQLPKACHPEQVWVLGSTGPENMR